MSKVNEAIQILEAFGLPKQQQSERSALTLLALCSIKEGDKWKDAQKTRWLLLVIGRMQNIMV